jgi:hypothetical protein
VNHIEIILQSPEYFYCEKTKCTLKVEICRQRQIKNRKTPAFLFTPFPICGKCEQGAKNMEEKTEKTIPKEQRLCEDCKQKPVISAGSALCASCLGRKAHKNKPEKESPQHTEKRPPTPPKPKPKEEPQEYHISSLTIDFEKYVTILQEIRKIAEEEMRPVNLQIIYILRHYLEANRSPLTKS